MRYREIITELFDTRGVKWESDTMATFEVGGEQFRAYFKRDTGGGSYYDFMFVHETPDPSTESGIKSTFSNTGKVKNSATRVFGYAIECIEEFLKRVHPHSIGFRGQKEDGRDELYSRMVPFLAKRLPALGYSIDSKVRGKGYRSEGGVDFTLTRQFDVPMKMPEPSPEREEDPNKLSPEQIQAALADFDNMSDEEMEELLGIRTGPEAWSTRRPRQ